MVFPLIGLLAGLGGAAINAASQSSTNRANAAATRDANAAARDENREAREWNRQQVLDERRYQEEQAAIAEGKARAAIAEDREYNSPAAVRARLEAAGINPNSGFQDASTAVSGYGPASVAIAQNIAQSSGVAFTNGAPVIAPQYQAVDVGSTLANAFANYGNAVQAQQELDLRKTALRLEEQQISNMVARANQKPVVGGVYDGPTNRSSSSVGGFGSGNAISDGYFGYALAPDKDNAGGVVTPEEVIPETISVYDPRTGKYYSTFNPDLMESGPLEYLTGLFTMGISRLGTNWADRYLNGSDAWRLNARPSTSKEYQDFLTFNQKPQRNISFDNSPPRRFNNGAGDRFMSEAQRWALE